MKTHYYASCFVVRPAGESHEFLQLLRAPGKYMGGTWQLVTGGIEEGETAWQTALRELKEETGLAPAEFFQLDVVNTFYIASFDTIFQSPMFCAIVPADAHVALNEEHTDYRWTQRESIAAALMWPGEKTAVAELLAEILNDGPAKAFLRLKV